MGVGVVTDNLAGTRPTRGAQIQISKSSCSQVPSRFRTTGSTGQSQVWGPDSLLSPLTAEWEPLYKGDPASGPGFDQNSLPATGDRPTAS